MHPGKGMVCYIKVNIQFIQYGHSCALTAAKTSFPLGKFLLRKEVTCNQNIESMKIPLSSIWVLSLR